MNSGHGPRPTARLPSPSGRVWRVWEPLVSSGGRFQVDAHQHLPLFSLPSAVRFTSKRTTSRPQKRINVTRPDTRRVLGRCTR